MRGTVAAIKSGYIQKEIAESAYKSQKEVETGEKCIVGVNKYITEEKLSYEILKVDPEVERKQIERVKKLKATRDNSKVKETLQKMKEIAESGENILPITIKAVKSYVTIGEICNVLREVFSEYKAPMIF